ADHPVGHTGHHDEVNAMTPQEFCYWLQGYSELGGERPTEEQWAQIKEHLKLVFTKVTPEFPAIRPDPVDRFPFDPNRVSCTTGGSADSGMICAVVGDKTYQGTNVGGMRCIGGIGEG